MTPSAGIKPTWLEIILLVGQCLAATYGLWSDISPSTLPVGAVPKGMGTSISIIALTMLIVVLAVARERHERNAFRADIDSAADRVGKLTTDIAGKLSLSVPFHERDFYSLWPAQVRLAQHAVDITHLGRIPPRGRDGEEEQLYFDNIRKLYSESRAEIRRVERWTDEKAEWIERLVAQFEGQRNFSLSLYKDPSEVEMPMAVSVCRVDDKFAWLIAMAEHQSTTGFRDVLLTGGRTVELVRQYFNSRLWARSVLMVDRGVLTEGWHRRSEF